MLAADLKTVQGYIKKLPEAVLFKQLFFAITKVKANPFNQEKFSRFGDQFYYEYLATIF